MLYLSVVTTAVTALYAAATASPLLPPPPHSFAAAAPALVAVGVAGWLNQLCITMGLARAPAARATAMGYTAVVLAAAADWALFGVCLDACAAVGGALIVLTALCVVLRR